MKKLIILLLIIVVSLGLAACAGDKGEDEEFKIALIMSGSKSDGGWDETAYKALLKAESDLGATISFSENTKPADFEKVIKSYAADGNNLVIAHGYQFGDAVLAVADEYPDVNFVVTSTDITNNTNVASLQNNYHQQGFLQGAFSTYMSKTGTVGMVGGMEIPPITKSMAGFAAGAEYAKSGTKALTAATGSFEDASKLKEQAISMIQQGADMITSNANQAGRGGYEAAREKGIYAIASISAEYETYADVLIACGEADMTTSIFQVCEAAKDGKFEAKPYLKGVKDGIVRLTYNPALEDKIPQDVKDKMTKMQEDMASGDLEVSDYVK